MAPILEAANIKAGMWVRVTEEWPTEVTKVTRCGPVLDMGDGRGPRRIKVRVTLATRVAHDLHEDSLVPTY